MSIKTIKELEDSGQMEAIKIFFEERGMNMPIQYYHSDSGDGRRINWGDCFNPTFGSDYSGYKKLLDEDKQSSSILDLLKELKSTGLIDGYQVTNFDQNNRPPYISVYNLEEDVSKYASCAHAINECGRIQRCTDLLREEINRDPNRNHNYATSGGYPLDKLDGVDHPIYAKLYMNGVIGVKINRYNLKPDISLVPFLKELIDNGAAVKVPNNLESEGFITFKIIDPDKFIEAFKDNPNILNGITKRIEANEPQPHDWVKRVGKSLNTSSGPFGYKGAGSN